MSEKHPLLYEPTTAITDYIIFILGITFGWFTLSIQDSQFHQLWGTSFITIAIGAFLGGTTHGFGPKLSQIPRTVIWRATLIFVAATGLLLAMSTALVFVTGKGEDALYITAGVLLISFYNRIRTQDNFQSVVIFYLPLMGISFIGFLVAFFYYGMTGALSISIGLLVSLAASWVQVMKIALHENFNHNDLFHVIQMLGMYLMYRGGLEIPPF